ncbi:hypothetical protein Lal_00024573 [Lupinus albus]|nr:hypothetical protein Lal_00024573 [Lupinus albus]
MDVGQYVGTWRIHFKLLFFDPILKNGDQKRICTAIYDRPSSNVQDSFWEYMVTLCNSIYLPWLILVEFNDIILPSEVRGGNFILHGATKFSITLESCGLMDLGAIVSRYTWFRRYQSGRIISKPLDHALFNCSWRREFSEAYVESLPN